MMCFREPELRVFGKSNCMQCDATLRQLDKEGIDFTYINIEEDPEAMEFVRNLGYLQAPVCIGRFPNGSEEHWSGYNPPRISGYANAARGWGHDG